MWARRSRPDATALGPSLTDASENLRASSGKNLWLRKSLNGEAFLLQGRQHQSQADTSGRLHT